MLLSSCLGRQINACSRRVFCTRTTMLQNKQKLTGLIQKSANTWQSPGIICGFKWLYIAAAELCSSWSAVMKGDNGTVYCLDKDKREKKRKK